MYTFCLEACFRHVFYIDFIVAFTWMFVFIGDKREDGENGILFNNEEEKEQWEEDQKVSAQKQYKYYL